mmetsp:Transcript_7794/g.16742  ORF Transcript_7794/g.16742 Transcript_7794/m.16742 type:complete len:245 (-) Transcript_7794:973-1707(-)
MQRGCHSPACWSGRPRQTQAHSHTGDAVVQGPGPRSNYRMLQQPSLLAGARWMRQTGSSSSSSSSIYRCIRQQHSSRSKAQGMAIMPRRQHPAAPGMPAHMPQRCMTRRPPPPRPRPHCPAPPCLSPSTCTCRMALQLSLRCPPCLSAVTATCGLEGRPQQKMLRRQGDGRLSMISTIEHDLNKHTSKAHRGELCIRMSCMHGCFCALQVVRQGAAGWAAYWCGDAMSSWTCGTCLLEPFERGR